jgi:hypothetical protein
MDKRLQQDPCPLDHTHTSWFVVATVNWLMWWMMMMDVDAVTSSLD